MILITLNILFIILSVNKLSHDLVTLENDYNNSLDSIVAVSASCRKNQLCSTRASPSTNYKTLLSLTLLLSGDIQLNSGPRNISVYPCGLCDYPVTWNCSGVACDSCNIWFHASCIELCSNDYELLNRSNVQWLCHKCDSINCDSFTFWSFSLNCSNYFTPLTDPNITIDSVNSSFSPLKTSSPHPKVKETSHIKTGLLLNQT